MCDLVCVRVSFLDYIFLKVTVGMKESLGFVVGEMILQFYQQRFD